MMLKSKSVSPIVILVFAVIPNISHPLFFIEHRFYFFRFLLRLVSVFIVVEV